MDITLPFINKQSLKPGQQVTWGAGSCRAEVVENKGSSVKIKLVHPAEAEGHNFPVGFVASFLPNELRLLS